MKTETYIPIQTAARMAFPDATNEFGQTGLTKLEYFAGLAMQALIQGTLGEPQRVMDDAMKNTGASTPEGVFAVMAIGQAEAICAELDKRKEGK